MNKGIAIYLTLMIMAVLLTAVFGMSAILLSQIKMIKEQGNSVIAFYAADTGVERELFEKNSPGITYSGSLANGSSFTVSVLSTSTIKSVGVFKNVRRAIQANR